MKLGRRWRTASSSVHYFSLLHLTRIDPNVNWNMISWLWNSILLWKGTYHCRTVLAAVIDFWDIHLCGFVLPLISWAKSYERTGYEIVWNKKKIRLQCVCILKQWYWGNKGRENIKIPTLPPVSSATQNLNLLCSKLPEEYNWIAV